MKIGIISNLYPPYQRGGAEHVVVRTVESFLDRWQDVFVITGKPFGQRELLERDRNAIERVYRFSPRNLYFSIHDYKFPWILRLLWHVIDTVVSLEKIPIESVLFREKPNVVFTHNLKGLGLRLPRLIQSMDIPHIHIMHDLQLIYPSGLLIWGKERFAWIFRPGYALYRFFTRKAIGKPDLVIFPSKFLQDQYLKHGFFKKTSTMVLPNPAPAVATEPKEERTPGPLRLLFVGQLEKHKGIDFLLKAFTHLEFPAVLSVAGEGPLRKEVNKEAKQNSSVVDLGYVSFEQLMDCLRSSDALVVPSLCYENSPTVIYEALSAGTPVIASDIGGVGELVSHGKNGFLFKPGDTQDLLRALSQLDDQKEAFGKRGDDIQQSVSPYRLDQYTDELMRLTQEIIAQKEQAEIQTP